MAVLVADPLTTPLSQANSAGTTDAPVVLSIAEIQGTAGALDLDIRTASDGIRTAFTYRAATVEPVGESTILISSPAFDNAREPLARAFEPMRASEGSTVLVIANHFKSKSRGAATGDNVHAGQGGYNGDRTRQARLWSRSPTGRRRWRRRRGWSSSAISTLMVRRIRSLRSQQPAMSTKCRRQASRRMPLTAWSARSIVSSPRQWPTAVCGC